MVERNWYAVLGLTTVANDVEIKKAFRKLAHIYHPDKNTNPVYFEQFAIIKKAYEILSDPSAKKLYDKSLSLYTPNASQKPIQNIQDILSYFQSLEKELQQTDFRFINYDRIKWKLNQPIFIPGFKEIIETSTSAQQEQLFRHSMYCLQFLPYKDVDPYLEIFRTCFLTETYSQRINQFHVDKKWESTWDVYQLPIVAIISVLICIAIYLLTK